MVKAVMTPEEKDLWIQVYVAVIRASWKKYNKNGDGLDPSREADFEASEAVRRFRHANSKSNS